MQSNKTKIRLALRHVCSQHLWMPVPKTLENAIVEVADKEIAIEDINASPYGLLFELAVNMAHIYHGYGRFASFYDDEITIQPIPHPEAFEDGDISTYRKIS